MDGLGYLVLAAFLLILLLSGLLVLALNRQEDLEARYSDRERQVQAELDALYSANRINTAFWNARQAMHDEAHRRHQPPKRH